MSKQYFIEQTGYNVWANNIVCDWLQQLSDKQWTQPVVSSFENIQATVLHILSAEIIWQQRMEKIETKWWAASFKGTKEEHIRFWKQGSENLKNFVLGLDENKLEETYEFSRLDGALNKQEYYQTFAHVCNHSTYHRGQLVTMLRQVGFTDVQSTDLSTYYRSLKEKN